MTAFLSSPIPGSLLAIGLLLVLCAYLCRRSNIATRIIGTLAGSLGLLFVAASQVGLPIAFTSAQLGLLPTQSTQVLRLGVYSPFDAPPLWFKPTNAVCSPVANIGTRVNSANGNCWNAEQPTAGLDLRQFGTSGSAVTTTATVTTGQAGITLAGASDFLTGHGIVIGGAGPFPIVTNPTGLAVASFCYGKSSYGTTVSGSPIITNFLKKGIAVGDLVTGTGIPGGTTVLGYNINTQTLRMSANATASGSLVAITATDPCNKTYYYRMASFDGSGGITQPLAAVFTTTGPQTPSTWAIVCLTWTRPAGTVPAGYAVWKSLDSGATYNFMQALNAEGSGACLNQAGPFMDGGQPSVERPWWIPNDPASIPFGGQPQWLRTSITVGGGTTSLTLANTSSQTITTSTDPIIGMVLHDDTDPWTRFFIALNAQGGTGVIPAVTSNGSSQAVYRTNTGGTITRSGVRLIASPGATIKPFGATIAGNSALTIAGSAGTNYTLGANFTENDNCVVLSSTAGLAKDSFLQFNQAGPGGSSQQADYYFVSRVQQLGCDNKANSVRLEDAAPITFSDAAHREVATITGTPAVGDSVTFTVSGQASCSATYVVVTNDTTTEIARGLALAINSSTCGPFSFATHSLNVVTATFDSTYSTLTFGSSTAHPAGGTEAVALSGGTTTAVASISPVMNVHVDGVMIDGTDNVGTLSGGGWVGVFSIYSAYGTYTNLTIINTVSNGSAITESVSYKNTFDNIYIRRGSGGTQNITSYADFVSYLSTGTKANNITSTEPASFGPQFAFGAYAQVTNLSTDGAYWGRGLKLAGTIGGQFTNINSSNNVFKDLAICCGAYRNSLTNIRTINSYGINQAGIGFFDAWSRENSFTNIVSSGNEYDWDSYPTDYGNTIYGLRTSDGVKRNTVSVSDSKTKLFGWNECQLAYQPEPFLQDLSLITPNPPCQVPSPAASENLLLNGGFELDQAHAGATVGFNDYFADGWKATSGVTSFSFTAGRSSVTPPAGQAFGGLFTITSLGTGPAAGEFVGINQDIPGFMLANTGFGATGAKKLSYSMTVNSSITANVGIAFYNQTSADGYTVMCRIPTANVDTKCSGTIPADVGNAWDRSSSNTSMRMFITLVAGTSYQCGPRVSWVSGLCLTNFDQTQFSLNNGATFKVSAVKLEAGAPTPFKNDIALEIARAQRFYRKSFPFGVAPAQNAGLAGARCGRTSSTTAGTFSLFEKFDTPMIGTPTITTFNPSAANANWRDVTGATDVVAQVDVSTAKADRGFELGTQTTTLTAGRDLCIHYTADSRL
jgi:hypothetical protein